MYGDSGHVKRMLKAFFKDYFNYEPLKNSIKKRDKFVLNNISNLYEHERYIYCLETDIMMASIQIIGAHQCLMHFLPKYNKYQNFFYLKMKQYESSKNEEYLHFLNDMYKRLD